MLVLARKPGEKVHIGNDIIVTVLNVHGDRVRLGFDCPARIPVFRDELYRKIRDAQAAHDQSERLDESPFHAEFA